MTMQRREFIARSCEAKTINEWFVRYFAISDFRCLDIRRLVRRRMLAPKPGPMLLQRPYGGERTFRLMGKLSLLIVRRGSGSPWSWK